MSVRIGLFVLVLAGGALAQAPNEQKSDQLSARELYYLEKAANEQLPAPSPAAGKRAKSKPTDTASSTRNGSQSHSDTSTHGKVPEPPHPAPQPIPAVDHLGLRYSLLLVNAGTAQSEPVDPDRVFHNGDCLALELEPNRAGYVYVLAKTSNGTWEALFPSQQMQGESEVVQARVKQRAPQNYCFELDEDTGEEHLYLVLSRNPEQIYDLHDALLKKGSGAETGTAPQTPTQVIADTTQFNTEAADTVTALASRGFKITKVGAAPQTGETKYSVYVVPAAQEKKDTVFADIRIKHQ
jgi:Domain of unknown function (DUF4384)